MKTFPQSNRRSKRHLTADVHGLAFGLWLDASCGVFLDVAGTVPANNGDPVACWRSRHDPSVKATQATLAKRPMYQLLNGVPRVVFDGVDDGLVLSDSFAGHPMSLFAVAVSQNFSASRVGTLLVLDGNALYGNFMNRGWAAYLNCEVVAEHQLSVPAVIAAVVRSANDVDLSHNGLVRNYAVASGWLARGAARVGADPSDTHYFLGHMFAVGLCREPLTAKRRTRLERFLAQQWGLDRYIGDPVPVGVGAPVFTGGTVEWDATETGWADVVLGWSFDHGSNPVAAIEVWRGTSPDGSDSDVVASVTSTDTSYRDAKAANGENQFYYRLRYSDGTTTGPFSDTLPVVIEL